MLRRIFLNIRLLCCVSLGCSLSIGLLASRNWPLIGDASLIHYVVFLLHHGLVPYRGIFDINLPGTYFFEALGMRIFGSGAFGWRLYDTFLLGTILWACILLVRKQASRFAAFFAAALLALIHLQDGIFDVGQRDLLMASLLVWAYVALFAAQREKRPILSIFLFGLASGAIATIKPVLLPLALVLLCFTAFPCRKDKRRFMGILLSGSLGIVTPLLAAWLWLGSNHALGSFWGSTRELIVLHAELGRRSMSYLLSHSVSPVALLVLLWLILQIVQRPKWTSFRLQLLVGVLGTLAAYLSQGKGFPYQRYPLLIILLILIGIDLDRAFESVPTARAIAYGIASIGSLLLGPQFAFTATHFSPATPFQNELGSQLSSIQSAYPLSQQVQCLDTFGGCIGVLYDRQIIQSTGFLYDCYFYTGPSVTRDRYREAFLEAFKTSKPQWLVVTDQDCFGGSQGFSKIERWPVLSQRIGSEYELYSTWHSAVLQHWWSRSDEPTAFKIYIRRSLEMNKLKGNIP